MSRRPEVRLTPEWPVPVVSAGLPGPAAVLPSGSVCLKRQDPDDHAPTPDARPNPAEPETRPSEALVWIR